MIAPKDWYEPQWDVEDKVHCWRNYVSDDLKNIWDTFDCDQKQIIAEAFQDIADAEDWD